MTARHRTAAEPHVAARVDGEVGQAGFVQEVGGTVDRPAVDEARGVEPAGGARVEVAARLQPERVAALDHEADVGVGALDYELPAADSVDLAVTGVKGA